MLPGRPKKGEKKNPEMDSDQAEVVVSARAESSRSRKYQIASYSKLVVPVSMRSIYWQFFGFPATAQGEIISRTRIVCILCRGQIAYNRNTSNLRMHLQTKHLPELIEIEASATPKTCKSKVLRQSVKIENIPDSNDQEETQFAFYTEDTDDNSAESATLAIEGVADDDAASAFYLETRKVVTKKTPKNKTTVDLKNAITTFMLMDLQPPELVNGIGFQRLLVTIENPCSVPSKTMVIDHIIPKQYYTTKERVMNELHNLSCDLAITIEGWLWGQDKQFVTISAHFPQNGETKTIACRNLTSFPVLSEMDVGHWENMLAQVFQEWNITPDLTMAVVCPVNNDAITDALKTLGYTPVPCLDNVIIECVTQCFTDEVIVEIIEKIRKQILLLRGNPLTIKSVSECLSEKEGISLPSLDVKEVWLSTLEMLESAVAWKDDAQKILDFVLGPPISSNLKVTNEEWDIISDLIAVLQPLKMTLLSIGEEKMAFLSLVRPMLWQVIEHKLSERVDESLTSSNLKKAIIDTLNYHYNNEKVSPLLDLATIVDPRFKLLPHYSEHEKNKIEDLICTALKDFCVVGEDTESSSASQDKKRLSSMEKLLDGLKPKKVKVDPEENSRLEYQTYLAQATPELDADPLDWWSKYGDKFPRVGRIADRYLCIPAVATLPRKLSPESILDFHGKRSTMPFDLIEQLLFLHVNYTIP